MIQIPLPRMVCDKALVVTRQAVKDPIRRRNVRVVEGTVHRLRCLLVPTRPTAPIQIAPVVTPRQFIWLIVEEAFSHAVLFRAVFVLYAAPQNAIDKLLIL